LKAFERAFVYVDGAVRKRNLRFTDTVVGFGGEPEESEVIAIPDQAIVVPGFIDRHIHGAGGADAMDGSEAALQTIASTLVEEGTTGFLATTMTQSKENVLRAMGAVKAYRAGEHTGARVLGVHLEGPFLSSRYKGAQKEEYLCPPSREIFDELNEASGNSIRAVTVAPEEAGAIELIKYLSGKGIEVSIGHTAASYEEVQRAIDAGAGSVTHTYNAQTPLHHREVGTVGAALLSDELTCELIADKIHVSVPAIRLLLKCKPKDKVALITDAIRAKGLGDGESELGGQPVYVKNGEARLRDGTLAGSVLRMNEAVKNLVLSGGATLSRAIDSATIVPARSLRIDGECGSIAVGKRADFTVLDPAFRVLMTIVGGEIVYRARN